MNPTQVLKRPVVTEKSTLLQERRKYVFEVQRRATKADIARAVETAFNVKVASVNTCMVRGKMKRFGRAQSRQPDWKKAIVTLRPGDAIQLFEGA
ncbi:MAG: 50S ribosomal protein L23 [Gemmatimonadetes bacterium]|nr:50S ribosomal protein L23 [Gemmatimonadota bacterium]